MTRRPIHTLLIANRGEIACRIIRTARRMGIATIAVFSDADEHALHVACADRAMRIGPPAARDSYLDSGAILHAAQASDADAIHPGYGFLAESADFADACLEHGLIFVGPPATAIRAMADKGRARALMAKAGVPVLPGHDEDAPVEVLASRAQEIGFPLLIKAAAGGGGKGMRIVQSPSEFPVALDAARREAVAAFGDGRVIMERFLPQARHVEVQIFADMFGRMAHLFDRDCSAQRRRQKLVEEAPAPELSDNMRLRMSEAAIACGAAVSYVGAGTVEFLVAGDQFYFMEMNTRLQVEHPVTEAITGQDLVEWQIRVARGEPLPLDQDGIVAKGHAIEARICAENPAQDFLPATGRIAWLRWHEMDGVRIDAGVRQGDEVAPHYDSLIAKIVAHGADRREALQRLDAALARTEIAGVATNKEFLSRVISHPEFNAARHDAAFVESRLAELLPHHDVVPARATVAAAFAVLRRMEQQAAPSPDAADPFSPWRDAGGWRLGARATREVSLARDGRDIQIEAAWREGGYALCIDGERHVVTGESDEEGVIALRIGDERLRARAVFVGDDLVVFLDGAAQRFSVPSDVRNGQAQAEPAGRLSSPLPGVVIAVMAEAGATVAKGAPLVRIEAMKMEHTISAPHAGRIETVRVRPGDSVAAGAELVVMEAAS